MNVPGLESLAPPLVAILLAIATRTVVLPLFTGVVVGAILTSFYRFEIESGSARIFFDAAYSSILGRDHLMVLGFSLMLGGMVGVLERCGGMVAVIDRLSGRLKSRDSSMHPLAIRNRAQRLIAATGLVIFFDDYANTLLVGGTMRTTADRYRVSREKLAYLVDSTSAPIAGLSVISTWAAIEMSYMADGLRSAGIESDSAAFDLFLRSIPFRFYPILALVMVGIVVWTGRDFGTMRRAEQDRWDQAPDSNFVSSDSPVQSKRLHWAAIIPILSCLIAVLATLFWTGLGGDAEAGGDEAKTGLILRWMGILGDGDPYLALVYGGGIGLCLAAVLHRLWGDVAWEKIGSSALAGSWQMMPAMVILWLAWALTDMTDQLRTGQYLATLLSTGVPVVALPSVVFLVAGGVAFATGTSWGTMGLLTPLAVRLSIEIADHSGLDAMAIVQQPIVLATSGAVLAGAIFGDHCSPISDTTVLSSRSSGCDHLAHVRTQLPYATTVAVISVVLGTLPASYGFSPWLCLSLATATIFIVMRTFGQTVNADHAVKADHAMPAVEPQYGDSHQTDGR